MHLTQKESIIPYISIGEGGSGIMNRLLPKDVDFIEKILKELPSNIFFKDTDCRYVFCTHYWRHLKIEDDVDWSIRGKTDLEVRKDVENARYAYEQDRRILETGKGCSYISEITQDGISEYLEIIKRPVRDDSGDIIGIVGIINDVTARIKMEKELEEYAKTDMLTGLYNRRYMNSWALNELKDEMFPMCIIYADCDGLKRINDSYGHIVGDELIRLTTSMFRICVPEDATMFRIGGDEFIIALPRTDSITGHRIIEKMHEASKLLSLKGEPLRVSIGMSVMNSREESFSTAIEQADRQMYDDKAERKANRNN